MTNFKSLKVFATVLFTASLIACGGGSENNAKVNIETYLKRSEAYQKQYQYRAAMIEARNAIQTEPNNPKAHIQLASIYIELGKSKAAIQQLNQVKNNKSLEYNLAMIKAYTSRRKFASAWLILQQNQELAKKNPLQYKLMSGNVQMGLGQHKNALENFNKILEISPGNIDALLGIVKVNARQGEYKKSIEGLDEILSLNQDHPESLLLRAKIDFNKGDLESSETTLTNLLGILPNTDIITPIRANTIRLISKTLTRQGRLNEAATFSKLLSQSFPKSTEISSKMELASDAYKNKDIDRASVLLQEVLEISPNHEEAGTLFGIISYLKGNVEMANQYLSRHVDIEIATESAKQTLAMTQLKLSNPRNVIEMLEASISETKNANLLTLYGIAALALKDQEKGLSSLRKALTLAPDKTRIHLTIANYFNSVNPPDRNAALSEIKQGYLLSSDDSAFQSALVHQFLLLKNKTKAQKIVDEILLKYSNEPDSFIIAGQHFLLLQKLSDASDMLKKALALNGKNLTALNLLATIALLDNKPQMATKTYEAIIKISPDHINSYRGIIKSAALTSNPSAGVERLQQLSNASPTAFAPRVALVEHYGRNGQLEKALAYIVQLESINTEGIDTNLLRGKVYLEMARKANVSKNWTATKGAALEGLNAVPDNLQLLGLLAKADISAGQFVEAQNIINQISILDSRKTNTILLKSELAEAQGDYISAEKIIMSQWVKSPTAILGKNYYALLNRIGKPQEAVKVLDEWLERYPENINALTTKGMLAQQSGDLNLATLLYEKSLAKNPNNVPVLNNLAWIYMENNDERSIEVAQRAYQIAPNSAFVADTYGWVLFKMGQIKKSIDPLRKAAKMAPTDKDIALHLKEASATSNRK